MDLDIAGGGQNGGHRILVLLVDRRDELIEIAFAHAGDAQEQGADHLLGHDAGEARQALPLEHRLQFVRRAGQQHGHGAGFLEPLAGRGAAIVGQDVGAFDDEGLALVDLGHVRAWRRRSAAPATSAISGWKISLRSSAMATASRVTSSSVGPRPPERITMGERAMDWRTWVGEAVAVVADDAFGDHFDAEIVQLGGEVERVGVDAIACEHLAADGDDFGVHQ